MKIHDVQQGTEAWLRARAGIPTASQFDKIITPKTRKLSSQADKYAMQLLAERILGRPLEDTKSFYWAERGKQLEDEARLWYEGTRNVDTQPIGFVTNDAGTIGASPDRLVGDDGLLEIKCPAPHTHMGYLLGDPVSQDYHLQVTGQLWISERSWCDVCSYHPELPTAVIRVERNEKDIAMLAELIGEFALQVERLRAQYRERGL